MSYYLNLEIIVLISSAFAVLFTLSVRKILFHTPNTDNELMAYSAAQSYKWRKPSDVHKYGLGKTAMKDTTVILIALFQRIFRDKKTDFPYTSMTGISVSVSTILIYLITTNYFNSQIGLFASALYIISFWPWQVALYGGHANIANLFFLLSIFTIQLPAQGVNQVLPLFSAGIFICLSLFSSPSAHKYIVPFWIAVSYTRYEILLQSGHAKSFYSFMLSPLVSVINLYLPIFVILSYLILLFSYKRIVSSMYLEKSFGFLNKIISGRNMFSLEHYIEVANRKLKKLRRTLMVGVISFLLLLDFVGPFMLIGVLTGFGITFLALTMPNIKQNMSKYFYYMLIMPKKTHFRMYADYFAKKGIIILPNMRGGGISWVPKIFFRFAPFHLIIFIVSFVYSIGLDLFNKQSSNLVTTIFIAGISLAPIVWAEVTRAPQASRLYSPGLITMSLMTSYALWKASFASDVYILLYIFIILPVFVWNLHKFVKDIYPYRMATRNLLKWIKFLGIKKLYTYDTNFNKCFIQGVPGISKSDYLPNDENVKPPFDVVYINSISEVKDGWIVIPPTTHKGVMMGSSRESLNGDFNKDPLLNRLLENHDIEKIATVKIPTPNASNIWVHEDDITSWRDLILNDFLSEDRFRGYGWILHSRDLAKLSIST